MNPPFTTEEFFNVFINYNTALYPSQAVILLLGIVAVALVHTTVRSKGLFISGFIGLLWIWTGLAYHFTFFTAINRAAWAFGGLFILQGLFMLHATFLKKGIKVEWEKKWHSYAGYFFIVFGLIIYPLIGFSIEGEAARTIALGLPCPTTIFTFGFFLLMTKSLPRYLLIIPSIWAVIGTSAAFNFGVHQDYVMLLAAIVANIGLISTSREK